MNAPAFAALGCREPFLAALAGRGYETPTAVQAESIPAGLAGRDLLVQSRTGSGKTLAFGLPILQLLEPRKGAQALILAPTRELAQQVAAELRSVQPGLAISLLVGGMPYGPQERALHMGSPVVVGTPGRIIDHLDRKNLDLSGATMLVLDECDEMLNMGFLEDVERILRDAPKQRQTYLFSATLPLPIAALAKRFLQDPVQLRLTEGHAAAAHADITHSACRVLPSFRAKALANILLKDAPKAALIFTRTKAESETLSGELREAGLAADFLNGDLAQSARNRILYSFKAGKIPFLVATDVAARGLDVEGLPLVIHMGIPTQMEGYIHRSGRTGRAGLKGTSLALLDPKETRIFQAWSRKGGFQVEWREVPGPAAIHEARLLRLEALLADHPSRASLDRAKHLLQERNAEQLVAALLELAANHETDGHEIPAITSSDERPFARSPKAFEKKWDKKGPAAPAKGYQGKNPSRDFPRKGGTPFKSKKNA